MKTKSTTLKAEGLGKSSEVQPRFSVQPPAGATSIPQLNDEQLVLDTIMQALRGLRIGGRPQVSDIAREWERIFNFRIQVAMQERQRRAKARLLRMQVSATLKSGTPTSSPSGVHIRLSVSPNRD